MNIQNYDFSEEEIEDLQRYRDNQEDVRLKIRFIALLLLTKKTNIRDISDVIGKSSITIERWLESYISKGINSLNSFGYKPKKTFLSDDQIEQLAKWVKETYPPNLKAVRTYVQETFNIVYTIAGIGKLLKKKGLNVSSQK
jgi:transposase